MLRRLILLAVCGLAPIFAVYAQAPAELPLSAELHVGTAGNNQPHLIWIPTRWTATVDKVRFMRRLVGTQSWQALDRMNDLRRREKLNLTHATPADFARLRQKLLSDFTGAAVRGYASSDDLSKLPKGDYEYGLFARIGDAEFLEAPVATAIWTQAPPRNLDAGLKPLGLFRDANGVQGQVAVDARRMMSWAVGVRVMERRSGFASPVDYPLLIPATRDGWTAICHRPKEPLPSELIFRVEDTFGNYVEQVVEIIFTRPAPGKPAADAKACMPVQPPYRAAMPRPNLSGDLELFVGSAYGEARIIWIPKKWPLGMDGVQIMRRRGSEPWTAVGNVRGPSDEFRSRLDAARNPLELQGIQRDLRSVWLEKTQYSGFAFVDKQAEEIPDGVVEYGAFAVTKGVRAAEPTATMPWLAGSETDADFGIRGPRMLRDGKNVVAVFSVDGAKLDENSGSLRILQIASYGGETLYTEVMDGGGPRKWKYLCAPIEVGRTRWVKFEPQNLFGQRASLVWPIDAEPATTTDPAAIAQCFIPPPPAAQAKRPMAISDVTDKPPPPAPPPPPRFTASSSPARVTSMVNVDDYFPRDARRRGEQGAPVVRVCVGPSGALLREPVVSESSGFPALDTAAIEVAKDMRYAAGLEGGVAPAESCVRFKVKFVQTSR